MQWSDEGIVLSARRHGESAAIVCLLTREHGRHAGLARGGAGRRARGLYQAGNRVAATWRARLAEHLGTYACEPLGAAAAALLDDPARLAGLAAACAMAEASLPEREPHPAAFAGLAALIEGLEGASWAQAYVGWEVGMLRELGYGLDLSACAATGSNDGLAYVSPKSGRAVSLSAGGPYRDRLLPLPGFLIGENGGGGGDEIAAGLRLTGYFLDRHVFAPHDRSLPPARLRLADRFPGGGAMSPKPD